MSYSVLVHVDYKDRRPAFEIVVSNDAIFVELMLVIFDDINKMVIKDKLTHKVIDLNSCVNISKFEIIKDKKVIAIIKVM